MKEFVFVQFLIEPDKVRECMSTLTQLGDDFQLTNKDEEYGAIPYGSVLVMIEGKISSESATLLKLSNQYLTDRMRISTISEELKNRYRTRP